MNLGMAEMIVLVLLIVVAIPAILNMARSGGKRREWEHAERMKALELGQPLPRNPPWIAWLGIIAIGAVVPLAVFICAWIATQSGSSHGAWETAMGIGITCGVGGTLIGITSVICGTILATREHASYARSKGGKVVPDLHDYDIVDRTA